MLSFKIFFLIYYTHHIIHKLSFQIYLNHTTFPLIQIITQSLIHFLKFIHSLSLKCYPQSKHSRNICSRAQVEAHIPYIPAILKDMILILITIWVTWSDRLESQL